MRKEYRSSNVRFCMDDENQRRTWEYLQSITRKEGSYGKILRRICSDIGWKPCNQNKKHCNKTFQSV